MTMVRECAASQVYYSDAAISSIRNASRGKLKLSIEASRRGGEPTLSSRAAEILGRSGNAITE